MLRIFRHYISSRLLLTLLGDIAAILGSVQIVQWQLNWIGSEPIWPKAIVLTMTTTFILYLADLYNLPLRFNRSELLIRILLASAISAVFFASFGYVIPQLRFGRIAFFTVIGLSTLGLAATRMLTLSLGANQRLRKRILVLGTGAGSEIASKELLNGPIPYTILGFLDDSPDAEDKIPGIYPLLGKSKDLLSVVEDMKPDIVVVALSDMRGSFPVKEILECRFRGIRVEEWATFYEKLTGKVYVSGLRPSWLIFSDGFVKTRLTETVKRALDVTLSAFGLVASAPVMALIAVAIKLDSPGPVLFRQVRVGRDGRRFVLKKFRSMRINAEENGPVWAMVDDPRVTRVGKWLRTTRLDELPQLINVLVGEMSFIGPRPERPVFVNRLREQIPFYGQRFSVKPGITGWAQVRYRYGSSVEDALEKLQYDLYYIKNLSVFLDLLILLNSVQVVLFAKGAR
jgi:sugar transferase (PEP-CTERM system associated)